MSGDTELLSASQVARELHWRKQDVLDGLAAGRIPSVTDPRGRRVTPRWMLREWQATWPKRAA